MFKDVVQSDVPRPSLDDTRTKADNSINSNTKRSENRNGNTHQGGNAVNHIPRGSASD